MDKYKNWSQEERDKIRNEAIKNIKENDLIFMADVCAMSSISHGTFYVMFPAQSEVSEELRELLTINKVSLKVQMRKKWFDSDNATLQMGLYKLTATDEERRMLSQTHQDITSGGKEIKDNEVKIVFQDFSEDDHLDED